LRAPWPPHHRGPHRQSNSRGRPCAAEDRGRPSGVACRADGGGGVHPARTGGRTCRARAAGRLPHRLDIHPPRGPQLQKKTVLASEQNRPGVARKRGRWKTLQGRIDPRRLVFIDETWSKTNGAVARVGSARPAPAGRDQARKSDRRQRRAAHAEQWISTQVMDARRPRCMWRRWRQLRGGRRFCWRAPDGTILKIGAIMASSGSAVARAREARATSQRVVRCLLRSHGLPWKSWMLLRTSPIRCLSDSVVTDGSEMIRCEGRRDFSMSMID
jgi:hypothetical protein